MHKTKLLTGVLLVLAVFFAQVGTALAAPVAQETTPISGMIQSITTETGANNITTVLVTFVPSGGTVSQTVRLSLETAAALNLVSLDPTTGAPVVDQSKIGQTVEIDPTTILPDEQPDEEPVHPIAAILAKFFGVEPSVVQGYHDDGYGFGVIAQAMWMAKGLGEDTEGTLVDVGLILEAKKSGDYSAFTLPDGSTPTNWGQFKKAAIGKDKKNLGVIVSGHADTDEAQVQPSSNHGNGNDNGNGNGKDNHPGKGNGKDKKP
jgi:hypothetical protein